ncbi:MAG TPA: hypothetical protein VFD14_04990, partial [Clostridia bacterium]|nr:hypothetical protein [Clostridia bacterium]
ALKGPRNWDPTDPDWPGYQTPSQPEPVEPPTTVTEPLPQETESSLTAPEVTPVTETSPTTEESSHVTTTLPPDSDPDLSTEDPPEPEAGD